MWLEWLKKENTHPVKIMIFMSYSCKWCTWWWLVEDVVNESWTSLIPVWFTSMSKCSVELKKEEQSSNKTFYVHFYDSRQHVWLMPSMLDAPHIHSEAQRCRRDDLVLKQHNGTWKPPKKDPVHESEINSLEWAERSRAACQMMS